MRETEPDEIKLVMSRLAAFDGGIKEKVVNQLAKPFDRLRQHRLFYLLLDDRTYDPLIRAYTILKKYGHQPYVGRALKIMQDDGDPIQYNANVAEIIAVAYYIEKFNYEQGKVTWVRKVSDTGNSVDITIHGYDKPINIEITGLTEMKEIQDFYKDSTAFRFKLRALVMDEANPRYSYFVGFPGADFVDVKDAGFVKEFMEKHVEDFANFIKTERAKGAGDYVYETADGIRASVKILKLNKAKKEYVENAFGWSGWLNDSFRMRSKVLEKARAQLPPDEFNFVYVANLAMLDDDDYLDAMHGQLQVVVNTADLSKHRTRYADNGISKAIDDEGLSPVYGLIKSKLDYFDKTERKVIANNRIEIGDDILEAIA